MAQITNKGKAWELRNSIWMLWAILTFGALNYISFFYASYKVKRKKWFFAAIIYSIIFILTMVVTEVVPIEHWFYDLTLAAYFIGWIFSIVHVFKIRPEYLLRLEAIVSSGYKEKEIESLKRKISQEYVTTISNEDAQKSITSTTIHKQPKEFEQEAIKENKISPSDIQIVNVNTASEQELAKVPGIGSIFAKKVISVRNQENGFKSFDHFVEILSIKPHLIEKIKPHLNFSESSDHDVVKKSEGRIVDF
ncbi:ComEA family DNA-binding protein [Metabacillus halosaccharovorans]|uniref:helix-hairpin-helix domain-containing protein n=1 Tax=Metabacillus halosaccharovorans TaxID=930124 RepID=UPI00403E3269